MKKNNYAIVVAHPDDEIIFASSILTNSKKIIICFNQIFDNIIQTRGRKKVKDIYPLPNAYFLDIPQARPGAVNINWKYPVLNNYGIEGGRNKKEYISNYFLLKSKLKEMLTGIEKVYTHNPWGEYGHADHIQVHRVIKSLQNELKYKIMVFGYASKNTLKLMELSKWNLKSNPEIENSNKLIYNKIKKIYIRNSCWTWHENYKLPDRELFYKLTRNNEKSKNNNGSIIINFIFLKEHFISNNLLIKNSNILLSKICSVLFFNIKRILKKILIKKKDL